MGRPTTASMISRIKRLIKDMGTRTLSDSSANEAVRHWNIRRAVNRVAERSLSSDLRYYLLQSESGSDFRRFCERSGLVFVPSHRANGWIVRAVRYRGVWYVRAGCKILPRELALHYWGPAYQAIKGPALLTHRNKIFAFAKNAPKNAVTPRQKRAR
jgi:hypothetical protein